MKKIFLTLAVALVGLTAGAQEKGDIRFGVIAGMNISNTTDYDLENDSRVGFHVGVKAEYNFSQNFYGNVGILFTEKGCKYSEGEGDWTYEETQNPGYIEVPINFGYRYAVTDAVTVFGETGPYFAYGICGKCKQVNKAEGEPDEISEADFFDEDRLYKTKIRRFDIGWGLKLGVEAYKCQLAIGYEFGIPGLSSVYPGLVAYHTNFMVSASYMF